LAQILGLREALTTQQIHYWLVLFEKARDQSHYCEGRWWVWNSTEAWTSNFPFWTPAVMRTILSSLRHTYEPKGIKRGAVVVKDSRLRRGPVLLTGNFNRKGYDRTLWYTIDYDELARLELAFRKMSEIEVEFPKTENPHSVSNSPGTEPLTTEQPLVAEGPLELAAKLAPCKEDWTDPRDVSGWSSAPVDAFCRHVAQFPSDGEPANKRESWGREL